MKTLEMNLYLMAEQYITVISPKHHLLNWIHENNKIAQLWLIVSYFPNSSDEQVLILLLAVYLFLPAAPTSKISAPGVTGWLSAWSTQLLILES